MEAGRLGSRPPAPKRVSFQHSDDSYLLSQTPFKDLIKYTDPFPGKSIYANANNFSINFQGFGDTLDTPYESMKLSG